MVAYAAVVFVRIQSGHGFHTQLLTSKTRVAPTNQVSLPRLELKGARLLAELLVSSRKSMEISIDHVFAWCDSTIALSWIHGHPSRWKTFVANQVSQIQGLIDPGKWKYINTKENPADVASRGCQPDELKSNELWWTGPKWLKEQDINWPKQPPAMEFLTTEEMKSSHRSAIRTVCVGAIESSGGSECIRVENYSSLTRLVRVTAFCNRFINNYVGVSPTSGCLTTAELAAALQIWVRKHQLKYFPVEYTTLINKE